MDHLAGVTLNSILYFAGASLILIPYLVFATRKRGKRSEVLKLFAEKNSLTFANESTKLKSYLDSKQLTLFSGGNVTNIFTLQVHGYEAVLFEYEFKEFRLDNEARSGVLVKLKGQNLPYFKLRVQEFLEKSSIKTLSLGVNGRKISGAHMPTWLRNIVHAYAPRETHKQVFEFLNERRDIERLVIKSNFSGMCGGEEVVILYNYGFMEASKEMLIEKRLCAERLIQIFKE